MPEREVVITGIGCVSPNGIGQAAFFGALARGVSGLKRISAFSPEGLTCTVAGEISNFDPMLWISKKDAPHVSRAVPLALAASAEALETAGLQPDELPLSERRRFGVMVGSGGGSIEFTERLYEGFFRAGARGASVYAVPSNTMGSLSSEVSMCFDLKGLSHVISTGCTSSTDAIGYAYHHIRYGRMDRVLAGGVDAPITYGTMAGFCLMRVVATGWNEMPEKASRPFSKDRDGFVLGEGAWMFLLEEKRSALGRGATILAEIAGYGATCDAYHRVRMDESGEESARAIRLALEDAAIPPDAVDYVNMHGTSTQLNDRVETRAIRSVFAGQLERLPASSTKSMIGHPQGASGAAGLAATVFAMKQGILPPTINLDSPDPECDLDYVPDIGRRHAVEHALCNCLGFGSKNSALIIKNRND